MENGFRISLQHKIFGGYVLFIFIAVLVNLYAISQLRILSTIARTMEERDLPRIALVKDMVAKWKSKKSKEIRYLSFRDEEKLNEYHVASGEFKKGVDSLYLITGRSGKVTQIDTVNMIHRQYDALFNRRINAEKSVSSVQQVKILDRRLEREHSRMELELEKILVHVEHSLEAARSESMRISERTTRYVIVLASLLLIIGVVMGTALAMGIAGPLRRLTVTADHVAMGNFKDRVEVKTRDEVADLANSFNHMAARLAKLDEIKADFISHASHELRTPVAAIKNATSLFIDITDQDLSDDQQKLLRIIGENTTRLTKLINDLLDVARLESDQVKLVRSQTPLDKLVETCLTSLEPLAREGKVTMSSHVYGRPAPLLIDAEKVEQVVTNLLSNAIKFTRAGGRITVEIEEKGAVTEVRVVDTGVGIPAEKVASVFDKFQQVKNRKESPTKGTGLGLTICKHIIEAHGGTIWAESEEGRGSTFFFTLPRDPGG